MLLTIKAKDDQEAGGLMLASLLIDQGKKISDIAKEVNIPKAKIRSLKKDKKKCNDILIRT